MATVLAEQALRRTARQMKPSLPAPRWAHYTGWQPVGRPADPGRVQRRRVGRERRRDVTVGVGQRRGDSVRGPAHDTGIVALKATRGRIPITGHWPEVPRRD